MLEHSRELLIVGLVESGKTSFVHAVDELLHAPSTGSALRAAGLASDRTSLERDKSRFRAGEKLERTKRRPHGAPPELWFEDPGTSLRARLFLPDVSGEVYHDQWVSRAWEQDYAEGLDRVSGVLLFVRADRSGTNAELLGPLVSGARPPALVAWESKRASAQAQLVDVFQFMKTRETVRWPLRVAIMMSAWDVIAKLGSNAPTPDALLYTQWALLAQFFGNNTDCFETKIYGVSALGGTFEELAAMRGTPPAERVMLVDGKAESRDLTAPLRWLLRLD